MAKKEGKKDACYHKVKSRYSVWPSAYASGALVKCRKVGAKNWGTKSEDMEFYNLISDYLIEEGFAYDENSVDAVILKLDESLLIQIYERKMTKGEKKKETKLKGKYDDSAMKQNMINQYGKEEGEKIYFATIRKQAMEEVEVEEGYKEIDKDKENRMYRRAGNLARQSLASKGQKKYAAAKKSANIVSAITRQKENERFAKMADEKARDNYNEERKAFMGASGSQIKRSTGAGALTPDAAKQLGPKAVELQKKKASQTSLPNIKKEELDINPAVDYFFSEGINEDGLEMIIQEVGLEKFVEFVEYFSDQELLTEARAAKRRKGGKSYEEVKAEIDAKEKAKKAKREISVDKGTKAVETAKAKQPEKKPVRDAIARGVFGAVKAYQSGMERHRKAMELAKETGKTVAKAAAVTHEAGRRAGESKVGQAVKKAGSAAIKAGVEKAKKDIQSLKKEEVEIDEKFSMTADRTKPQSSKPTKLPKGREKNIGKHDDWSENPNRDFGERSEGGKKLRSRAVAVVGTQKRQDKETGVREEVEIGEELHPNVKKIDAISKQRVQQKAADAQRARERMASSAAAFQAHKKEVISKGGTPVDALDSWQKKKMKKEEVEVEESTKLFYKLQAKGKGRSSTAKAQTTRDSNLEDQKSAKMRRQQAKQRQEREGDDKYGHPSLSAAERNPRMR